MRNILHKIRNFFYYGWVGKDLYDFDAHGCYNLIHAHIKRVKSFMYSDKTHLMWNDDEKNNLMRKLSEFEELSRQISNETIMNSRCYEELEKRHNEGACLRIPLTSKQKALMLLNWKQEKGKIDRFNYLFSKYIRYWWD
jgi:hypothetical protein